MEIMLGPDLEKALTELASRQGVAPEELALKVLQERLLPSAPTAAPRRNLKQILNAVAKDCGVSLSNSALSREEIYD